MSLTLLNLDRRSVSPEIGGGGVPERRPDARSGGCSADLREQTVDVVDVEALGGYAGARRQSLFHEGEGSSPVVVNGPPVTDAKHTNLLLFILDGADYAEVADPIPPQTDLFTTQRLPESARVLLAGKAFSQVAKDSPLDLIVETR
jgi:hypothetical protein